MSSADCGPIAGSADERLIRLALEAAQLAGADDVPIGAVVFADGVELARAATCGIKLADPDRTRGNPGRRAAAAVHGDGWRLEGATLVGYRRTVHHVRRRACDVAGGPRRLGRGTQDRRRRLLVGRGPRPAAGRIALEVRGGVLEAECAAPMEGFFARQR